jgi:sodium-dependent phosphate cotransporter
LSAIAAGLAITVMVQSSSITTSLMIPLVGAGVVTLEQVFPFTIGANIGTTITAMLAALSTGSPAAVTVAFSHLMFNLSASVLIYLPPPIRAIPLYLARTLGRIGGQNRLMAAAYILLVFFGLPLLMLLVTGVL